MALTQVKTSGLADDAVTQDKVANDAIDLTEIKAGTDGNLITYDASGNPTVVATGNDGQVLTSQGTGNVPQFETLPASNNYSHPNHSGDVTSSGDGATTIANDAVTAAKTDLSIVQGDVIYGTGTDAWARLAKGTAAQVLAMNSGATAPEWADASGGLFTRGWYDKDSTELTVEGSDGETRVGGNSGADLSITLTPTSTNCRYLIQAQFHYRKHTSTGQWGWRVQRKLSGSWGSVGMMHPSYGEEWQEGTFRTVGTQTTIYHPNTTSELEFGLFCQVWSSHGIKIDCNASINPSSILILEIPDTTNFSGI